MNDSVTPNSSHDVRVEFDPALDAEVSITYDEVGMLVTFGRIPLAPRTGDALTLILRNHAVKAVEGER